MIDVSVLPAFIAVIMLFLLPPGPDMAYMIAVGLQGGRWAAVQAILGIVTGMWIYAGAAIAGIGQVAASHPAMLDTVKLLGAVYLLWLAFITIRGARHAVSTSNEISSKQWYFRGFMVSITNPKIILFFLAVLPQFIGDAQSVVLQSTILGAIDIFLEFVLYGSIGIFAGVFQSKFMANARAQTVLNYVASGVYLTLAAVIGGEMILS